MPTPLTDVDYSNLEVRVATWHNEALTDLRKLLAAYHPSQPMGPGMRAQYSDIMRRLGWQTPFQP